MDIENHSEDIPESPEIAEKKEIPEYMDAIGSMSAHISDGGSLDADQANKIVFGYVSGFLKGLYDPEKGLIDQQTGKPKFTEEESIQQLRDALEHAPHS